ncbi:MAG: BACON domain-containing protein [Planctomycetota bacterium]|jgi:hypothetical protein
MSPIREFTGLLLASVVLAAACATVYAEPLGTPVIRDCYFLHERHSAQYKNADAYDLMKVGNYVYACTFDGLEVVDVSDPDNLTGTFSWQSDKMWETDVAGAYLYIANWSPGIGLRVFDYLSNPAAPVYVTTKDTQGHAFGLTVNQNALYVIADGNGYEHIRVYNIGTPSNPSFDHYFEPGSLGASETNIVTFGDYMYIGANRWLYVYNASNPVNPTYVRKIYIDARIQRIHVYGNYLYLAATDWDYYSAYAGGLYVFFLGNPSNPSNVAGSGPYIDSDGGSSDLHTQGRYLVAVMGARTISTYDITDPAAPSLIHNNFPMWWDDDGDGNPIGWDDDFDGDPDDLGCHDGYTNPVTGAGNFVYVGTTHSGEMSGSEYCFGARLYCVQIAEGETEEPLDEVHIDLGSPDDEQGIIHPEGGDGDTEPVTIGGRVCRENVDPNSDLYFMFKVSDSFCYAGSKSDLHIGIDYYDQGTNSLTLQYDATSSIYMNGGSVTLTDTNTWKRHIYHVTDAHFGNRQNFAADFRIHGGGAGITFYLDTVHVAEAPPIPEIELSLSSITRTMPSGMNMSSDAFLVTNSGRGTLNYTITDDENWLSVSPDNGTSAGESDMISVNYSTSNLLSGNYSATITVEDPNSTNSPQTIAVTVTVEVTGKMDGDNDVDQEDFGLFQECYSGDGALYEAGCEMISRCYAGVWAGQIIRRHVNTGNVAVTTSK